MNTWLSIKQLACQSLMVWVGARVILAYDKDIEGKLNNGSTGTITYINGPRNSKPNVAMFNLTIHL